uniref:GLOBIN domain-containing protein n=1 Tax=Elaeophora elaphi TaxID=1147741 RepID=A0A0R3S5R7_9BILA
MSFGQGLTFSRRSTLDSKSTGQLEISTLHDFQFFCSQRAQFLSVRPRKPSTMSLEETSLSSRQQLPLAKHSCVKKDLMPSRCSSRHQKNTESVRSHSENRKLSQNLLASNLEALSRSCSNLRQALQPNIEISGDLTTTQNNAIRRLWKQELKNCRENELELASRLLLRIFAIDSRLQAPFHLSNVPYYELRKNQLFEIYVKAIESTLSFIMLHLYNPTAMSKSLQALGAQHVIYTGIQYRSSYWKIVNQAFIEFVNADRTSVDVFDAWNVLGNFCVEQMRIGYKIEYKAQKVLERLRAAKNVAKR